MASFFNKFRGAGNGSSTSNSKDWGNKKKDDSAPDATPLERMLQSAGPLRKDGSDKFFGIENFGNTCYCNSIVQVLFYSDLFRENVLNYSPYPESDLPNGRKSSSFQVTHRPTSQTSNPALAKQKPLSAAESMLRRKQPTSATPPIPNTAQVALRPEDKPDSPEYKKKQAMIKGPVLELAQDHVNAYGLDEGTFTGLKDIFRALVESESRTGVVSPQRFLEIFKRDNEMFRNSMHQDAHEFYGMVLNDVINTVETTSRQLRKQVQAKKLQDRQTAKESETLQTPTKEQFAQAANDAKVSVNGSANGSHVSGSVGRTSPTRSNDISGFQPPETGWVHDIFEGVLTSETKCLACETVSQRDETFLDLSIDLEEHSSVTSCLRNFSAEEMLCERNKFHCDHCGCLQEAEKRMKIKRLPKILALHLKRFKYTEDYSRLQKLFHRVVYPYQLRMFNTTEDAEDPDRLYELYGVVIHIGGNAYHGHYVSVIKTKDRGWLLFDDEMVEPVNKDFVRNFFGDKPGTACAYVLFYQETTFDAVVAEQEAEGASDEAKRMVNEATTILTNASNDGDNNSSTGTGNGIHRVAQTPQPAVSRKLLTPSEEKDIVFTGLAHANTAPEGLSAKPIPAQPGLTPDTAPANFLTNTQPPPTASSSLSSSFGRFELKFDSKSREEKKRQKRELEAEKARLQAEKEREKNKVSSELAAERPSGSNFSRSTDEAPHPPDSDPATTVAIDDSTADDGKKKDSGGSGFLNRTNRGSRSMARKSFAFLSKVKSDNAGTAVSTHTATAAPPGAASTPAQQDVVSVDTPAANGNAVANGDAAPAQPPLAPGDPLSSMPEEAVQSSDAPPAALPQQPRGDKTEKLRERFSFSLKRRKSQSLL